MNKRDIIRRIVSESAIYVPAEGEAIRISHFDTQEDFAECQAQSFYGQGEETGDEISVEFLAVDLDTDLFYGLQLVDVAKIQQTFGD